MNRMSTAREALFAEALGDMAILIDRLEKLAPVLSAAEKELAQTGNSLVSEVSMFEFRMNGVSDRAAESCLKQIAHQATGVCVETLDQQILAMQSAARELFSKHFDPKVSQVVFQLERLAQLAQPRSDPLMPWLTHGAAFVTGAALTWLVVVAIWFR
jgi:hypothetical protein